MPMVELSVKRAANVRFDRRMERVSLSPRERPRAFVTNQVLRGALRVLGLAALMVLGAGCAGYKLGPTGGQQAGARSVQINPVQNSTLLAALGPSLSHALRKQVQRDGTFLLDTKGTGDVVVNCDVVLYRRRGIAFQPNDTLTATDYELTAEVRVVATERLSGREILNKEVRGRTTIRIGSDQTSAERQAMPILAENLAYNITTLLVDGDW
jgi:hypothetical protein